MARARLATAVLVLLAACDEGGEWPGNGGAPDARVPDRPAPDASPPDAGLAIAPLHVLNYVAIPETANDANAASLDLDGDGNHDNALGGLLAALGNQIDLPFTPAVNAAITGGQALELIEVVSRSAVRIGPGMDLDEEPSDNFSGVEPLAFAFEPEPMPGAFDGYLLEAGPGPLVLRITLFDSVAPIDLPCVAARLRAEVGGREIGDGKLGLGLLEETVNTVLIPHLRNGFAVIVAADCPGGECVPGSGGELLLEFFDEDESGGISLKELRQNSLIQSTMGNPDLDLFDAAGEFDPRADGIKETLSFGFAFTAVTAIAAE